MDLHPDCCQTAIRFYTMLLRASSSFDLATIPVICSTTLPSLKKMRVGMALIPCI